MGGANTCLIVLQPCQISSLLMKKEAPNPLGNLFLNLIIKKKT
ncbi:hypothetical protein HMPREF9074_09302 [Capnocytophaga sp. oral taxon 329 str. F0087]|nr:hypothetical protein HMPREF9074_09302 [Capnocytophaga sp. oral taxon 329 str. F0087]